MRTRGRPRYPETLTPRQQEVLALVREGLTNEEIAQRLGITLDGAKFHVSEILTRLGVSSRHEAADVALAPTPARRAWALALLRRLRPHAVAYAGVAVGVLAVAAVIGALAWGVMRTSGSAQQPGGVSAPGAAATDTAADRWIVAVDSATASAQHPVVWFRDDTDDRRLVAYDWDGKFAGAITLDATALDGGAQQSPDGTRLLLWSARPLTGATIVRAARTGYMVWSHDSKSLCEFLTPDGRIPTPTIIPISNNGYEFTYDPATLFTESTGSGKLHQVREVGGLSPESGPVVLACDADKDVAIIAHEAIGSVGSPSRVRLSDGANLGRITTGFATGDIAPSPDGTLAGIATGLAAYATPAPGEPQTQFFVEDLASGQVLATVAGDAVAFSDDNSRVLTVDQGHSSTDDVYHLVDWRTGQVYWTGSLPGRTLITRPHGSDFMLEPYEQRSFTPGASTYTRPFILHADGTTTDLAVEVRPAGG